MHVRRALVVRPCPPPRSAARTGRLALLRLRSSRLKLPRTEITNGLKQLAPLECLSHAGLTEIVVNHVAEVVDGFDAVPRERHGWGRGASGKCISRGWCVYLLLEANSNELVGRTR